jgi:hypothetical protein
LATTVIVNGSPEMASLGQSTQVTLKRVASAAGPTMPTTANPVVTAPTA